jgi:hypothetical protein
MKPGHSRHRWEKLSEREPWIVRHLYTVVDRSFGIYLDAMRDLLSRAEQAGWISARLDKPISLATEIADATGDTELGELLIVDLHGWADAHGARLSPAAEGPFADLANVPANSWGPAAIMLTNCRGTRDQFFGELSRVLRYPAAVAGHFDEADTWDHTPIEVVRTILAETDGGDDAGAFNAIDRSIYNREWRRGEVWGAERLQPCLRQP